MCGGGKEQDFFLCNSLVLWIFHGLNNSTNVNAFFSQGQTLGILLFSHHILVTNTSMFFYRNLLCFYFQYMHICYTTKDPQMINMYFFTLKNLFMRSSRIYSSGIPVNQIDNCINCLCPQVCRYLIFQHHTSCPFHDCIIVPFRHSILTHPQAPC
jgi:hypothetical protein